MYFLGTITAAAATAQNNRDTAVPFVIPPGTETLFLQADTTGVQFEFGTVAAFHTTAGRGAFLPAANVLSPGFTRGGVATLANAQDTVNPARGPAYGTSGIVSIFNPTGGAVNVKVFAGAPR